MYIGTRTSSFLTLFTVIIMPLPRFFFGGGGGGGGGSIVFGEDFPPPVCNPDQVRIMWNHNVANVSCNNISGVLPSSIIHHKYLLYIINTVGELSCMERCPHNFYNIIKKA